MRRKRQARPRKSRSAAGFQAGLRQPHPVARPGRQARIVEVVAGVVDHAAALAAFAVADEDVAAGHLLQEEGEILAAGLGLVIIKGQPLAHDGARHVHRRLCLQFGIHQRGKAACHLHLGPRAKAPRDAFRQLGQSPHDKCSGPRVKGADRATDMCRFGDHVIDRSRQQTER